MGGWVEICMVCVFIVIMQVSRPQRERTLVGRIILDYVDDDDD